MDTKMASTGRVGEAGVGVDGDSTSLHLAAWEGNLELVARLLDRGADVNALDRNGETALHGAAAWGDTRMVRLLIERGARVNHPGVSPLHWAAKYGNLEVLRLLLDAGADAFSRTEFGQTPEDLARVAGHRDAADLLRARATPC